MTPAVICQFLRKFGIFTCVCFTYNAFYRSFFAKGEESFRIFNWGTQKGDDFQRGIAHLRGNCLKTIILCLKISLSYNFKFVKTILKTHKRQQNTEAGTGGIFQKLAKFT